MTSTVPPKRVQEAAVTVDSPPGAPRDSGGFFGQPRGLSTLFFTEMWERFSFYGMKALLFLYLTKYHLFTDDNGYLLLGTYAGLAYALPLLGGALADRALALASTAADAPSCA